MDSSAKIIILRGNSGSGKTTIAKILQQKLGRGTLLISQDTIRREILYVRDEPGNKSIGLMMELVNYGMKNCDTVILEGILYADYYHSLFEMIKQAYGNNIYAFYFDIPFEETLIRHQTKSASHEFGEKEMKRWWREKDYINLIPEHSIDKEMQVDSIVDMIINQIVN